MFGVISSRFGFVVANGTLAACIASLEEALSAMSETPYHSVLGRSFLHHTQGAAEYLTEFHRGAGEEGIPIAAIYCEMNGFDINTNRWFFNAFGYKIAGDTWNLRWLSDWQAEMDRDFTLTGMEPVQKAFKKLVGKPKQKLSIEIAGELAEHLVTARFMELIAAAHRHAQKAYRGLKGFPVLATAHDWDRVHQS